MKLMNWYSCGGGFLCVIFCHKQICSDVQCNVAQCQVSTRCNIYIMVAKSV